MIFELIIGLFVALVELVLSVIPSIPVPGWVDDGADALGSVMDNFAGMSAWLPVSLAFNIAGTVLACWAAAFAIKGARVVASFFTGGGGSAA